GAPLRRGNGRQLVRRGDGPVHRRGAASRRGPGTVPRPSRRATLAIVVDGFRVPAHPPGDGPGDNAGGATDGGGDRQGLLRGNLRREVICGGGGDLWAAAARRTSARRISRRAPADDAPASVTITLASGEPRAARVVSGDVSGGLEAARRCAAARRIRVS